MTEEHRPTTHSLAHASVKDILRLPVARTMRMEAGSSGLDRAISDIEILDYEFTPGVMVERDILLSPQSLVVTSLLFAQREPRLVRDALERLISMGCSGLLYKRVVFDRLPADALAFADAHDFPIASFGEDITFERLIFDVQTFLGRLSQHGRADEAIRRLLEEGAHGQDAMDAARALLGEPRRYVKAYGVQYRQASPEYRAEQFRRVVDLGGDDHDRLALGTYHDLLVVVVTGSRDQEAVYDEAARRVVRRLPTDTDTPCLGESGLHETADLAQALREACQACVVGMLEDQVHTRYPLIGTYKVVLDPRAQDTLFGFADDYLKPLLAQQGEDAQVLLQTAVAYVQSKGSVEEASRRLCCHQNTVRYRFGKLRGILKQYSADEEINYEELSLAVKIYLYRQHLESR